MNNLEKKMVDVLIDLRENHHVVGVKAEFEAEGTRMEESLRLKEVVTKAGLELAIKIGGCEAIRDMYEARVIGVNTIIAPMVESPYALLKYLKSVKTSFPVEELESTKFLINIETISGYNAFPEMLMLPQIHELKGIVLGRVDMTGSMGLTREDINSPQIFDLTLNLFDMAKERGLECVIGGGVSAQTLPFLRRLPAGMVDRFETRKVIFDCARAVNDEQAENGILKAVGFELMWLKNKRDFYKSIYEEDMERINMLQSRYDKLIEQAGGSYE